MFIEELNIRGYGRFSNLRLEPSRGLNVFHGPPGAGKTTLCNCMRDLLWGPGQWDSADEGGPRVPYARPWNGERFQARFRYTVGASSYTVQRDFEDMTVRARDDNAGQSIEVDDARAAAPGVVRTGLGESEAVDEPAPQDASQQRLQAARARAAETAREAAAWECRHTRALLSDVELRLRKAAEMEREAAALRPQLEKQQAFAHVAREQRDVVIRTSARLHTIEREVAEAEKTLEALKASRRELGTKLGTYERFYSVTDADLELIKGLDLAEGPSSSQLDEKEKNLAGFVAKESDIRKRLDEIGTRFQNVDNDDDFDMRLNEHERELGRSELRTAKVIERDRLKADTDPLRSSSKRYLLLALVTLLIGILFIVVAFMLHGDRAMVIGVGAVCILGSVGLFFKKGRDDTRARDLEADSARVATDLQKLDETIDAARKQVQVMLEAAGVQTIKDLRALHREFRSLQRDAETVRAYRKELERDLEVTRKKSGAKKVETPRLLIECNILADGEPPTPRAVADFFDAFHHFKALQQEEDGLKKQMSKLQGDLADRAHERDALKAEHDAALRAMGLKSELEMDDAFAGKREYDRVKAELEVLEEKMRSVMRGMAHDAATRHVEQGRARLSEIEQTWPDLGTLDASSDHLEEYRTKMQLAQQQAAMAQGEVTALEGGDATPAAAPAPAALSADALARQMAEAWKRVTQRPLEVRVRERQGATQIEVRERSDGAWLPASTVGSGGAHLLSVLLEGERGRHGGPAFIDNPFNLLDAASQARLAEWLLDVADSAQVFVTLSDGLEGLRGALTARGQAVTESREDGIEILSAAARVGTPG